MSLVDSQLRNSISPGKQKAAVEISLSQLELEEEGKKEVKGEAEAEEVEKEVYDKKIYEEEDEVTYEEEEEEDEDEIFEMCGVCLKDKEHWSDECPYLVCIPNPTEVTLGEGYDMVCVDCNVLGGHSDIAGMDCKVFGGTPWMGRARRRYCVICKCFDHRYQDCPEKYLLETQTSVLDFAADIRSMMAAKESQAT